MNIAFTGHRDKVAKESDLRALTDEFPQAIWIHGGAIGFDSQVNVFASRLGITQKIIRPDYLHHGHSAPLIRNRQIVSNADILVACYDGRQSGGTAYTIKQAQKLKKPIRFLALA